MEIKLTPTERLILSNQFRILSQLNPDSPFEHYEANAIILENGYEGDYRKIFSGIDLNGIDASITNEVREILNMFRNINNAILSLKPSYNIEKLSFTGFDAHEYPNHYIYSDFLINQLNLYKEQKEVNLNGYDSMYSMEKYQKLLSVYSQIESKHSLSNSDLENLSKAIE